jgi:hypothetical protein
MILGSKTRLVLDYGSSWYQIGTLLLLTYGPMAGRGPLPPVLWKGQDFVCALKVLGIEYSLIMDKRSNLSGTVARFC